MEQDPMSFAPESEEQLLSAVKLKGGDYFCCASHYPMIHTSKKRCNAGDIDLCFDKGF